MSKIEVNTWKSEQDRKVLFLCRKLGKDAYMETIISACISAGVTLIVCMINSSHQREQARAEQEQTRNLMEYKLDELTKRVDKHNNVIERTYDVERNIELIEEKLKVANHRIEDLERKDG